MARRTRLLLMQGGFIAATLMSAPVAAQEVVPSTGPAAAADAAPGQPDGSEIVVTGSRIPVPQLSGVSPVTIVTDTEIKLQGATRTEDIINALPQAFGAQGSSLSNGSTGTATVDLRGLGVTRTLVLVNGRRLLPGDPRSPAADINAVPSALIKRVDVLTGGASSVYGSDAVAGVVNFVLDERFEGIRVQAQTSVFSHNNDTNDTVRGLLNARGLPYPTGNVADGGIQDVNGVVGASFLDGRGHISAYAGYRHSDPILQASRDFSSCSLSGAPLACSGSSFSVGGRYFLANGSSVTVEGNNFRPFDVNRDLFNLAPYNYYQREDERITAGGFASFEVSPAAEVYGEFMFMRDRTVAQIAPSGNPGATLTVPCDNPFLTAAQRGVVCAASNLVDADRNGVADIVTRPNGTTTTLANLQINRRFTEGGPRRDSIEHTAYRAVGGVRGTVATGLSYDAYYQYGRVDFDDAYARDYSRARLARSIDATTVNGRPVCVSVLNGTDPSCVAYNPFAAGGLTPEALNYLTITALQDGYTEEQVANGSVTAQLGEYGVASPFANEGLSINAGYEYRKEKLVQRPDAFFQQGDLAGFGGATNPLSGSFSVNEVFVEGRLPLVEDRPFFASLGLEGGYRRSWYDAGGNSFGTDTYKIAADWTPVRGVRLRGGYNRAVRAPNIVELFSLQTTGLGSPTDPCAGAAVNGRVNGYTLEQCARTGVSAAQFGNITTNPANQYNALSGGNPDLTPERADTYTAGVVLTPAMLRGLSLTADFFDIKLDNQVGTLGAANILNQCVNTGDYCNLIVRDQFGSLFRTRDGYVINTNINAGRLLTRGVDVGGAFSRRFNWGTIDLNLVGTYLIDYKVTRPGTPEYDCTGTYGTVCGIPRPEWRHKVRLSYSTPSNTTISAAWRYIGPVDLDRSLTSISAVPAANAPLGSRSYFDLALSLRVTDKMDFRVGANNVFDRDPPLVNGTNLLATLGNGNTFPQIYDYAGRYLFAAVQVGF